MPLPEGWSNCIPFFRSQDSIHNVIYHLLHPWSSFVHLTLHPCVFSNVDLFISLWLMSTAWIINGNYLILILSFSLVSLCSLIILGNLHHYHFSLLCLFFLSPFSSYSWNSPQCWQWTFDNHLACLCLLRVLRRPVLRQMTAALSWWMTPPANGQLQLTQRRRGEVP